jgi:hypothetical protein
MTKARGRGVCRVRGGERKQRDVCVCVCEVEGGERRGRDVCVRVCEDFVSLRVDRLLRQRQSFS